MAVQTRGSASSQLRAWLDSGDWKHAVAEVAVGSLAVADSPRMTGEDPEHVQALAAADAELPPIIVHHSTMRVIDGMHRVSVAKLRGREKIAAHFFYGDEADAFILAVKANVTHGLPLSKADRKLAAERILKSHPHWSDRMIAAVSGLAAKTIAEIRGRNSEIWSHGDGRIGRDGRVRPIDAAGGRLLAAELIAGNPDLSLRQVARAAGISPETARDVRHRLRRGEPPVPPGRAHGRLGRGRVGHRGGPPSQLAPAEGLARASAASPAAIIERLRADPALRFTETGRSLLRLLHLHAVELEEWRKIGENVPPHCSGMVAYLAREYSRRWNELADRLDQKVVESA